MAEKARETPIIPIILCGGSGMRLWPLSRQKLPKPFLNTGWGPTLFMSAVLRARALSPDANPVIVCNEALGGRVLADLKDAKISADIILEPEARNTAPAIGLGALAASERHNDPLLLISPSDHLIEDQQSFLSAARKAVPLAESGSAALFGATPDRPECGYGYIEAGREISRGLREVKSFIEKPDITKARAMLKRDNFYWNCGVFLIRASALMEELERGAKAVSLACKNAWAGRREDRPFIIPKAEAFLKSPSISIDHAVMESSKRSVMAPLETGWRDMGGWNSFYEISAKDENGNSVCGDAILEDAQNCYVRSEKRLVAALGVRDLAIIECGDAVLVAPRDRAQEVKKIPERLKAAGREEFSAPAETRPPRGSGEILACGGSFLVKKITVAPGRGLSPPPCPFRKNWVAASGAAEITINGASAIYAEGQPALIPAGAAHSLRNPGREPLELIEIQTESPAAKEQA